MGKVINFQELKRANATGQDRVKYHGVELDPSVKFFNPFNASCSKLMLFEGSSAILV